MADLLTAAAQGTPNGYCHCGCGRQTKVSPWDEPSHGYVKGKPRRFVKGHHRRKSATYQVTDAGYETLCWLWLGAATGSGYGTLYADGQLVTAHRYFYELAVGPVPVGLHLDHLCRNRACVNPAHLEPVTCAENLRRGVGTRLTHGEVAEIRDLVARGVRQAEVARRFGVGPSHVSRICNRRRWR